MKILRKTNLSAISKPSLDSEGIRRVGESKVSNGGLRIINPYQIRNQIHPYNTEGQTDKHLQSSLATIFISECLHFRIW